MHNWIDLMYIFTVQYTKQQQVIYALTSIVHVDLYMTRDGSLR